MLNLRKQYLVALPLLLVLLTSCATKEKVDIASPDEEIEEVELGVTERVMQVNEEGLAIPIEILAEWGDMHLIEKMSLVEASLEYHVALGEVEGTPVRIEGSAEAFVEAMDLHYLEIERRPDDLEKNEVMNSLIAEQIGAVGHANHLMGGE